MPSPSVLWRYQAVIARWVDGDTVDVVVDLGFYTRRVERMRLIGSMRGIDTAELHATDPAERTRARAARDMVVALAPPGSDVIVLTQRAARGDPRDGFGRFLAQVVTPEGVNIGDALLQSGLAQPYARGPVLP